MTEKEIKEAESVKHRLQKYRDLEEGAAQIQAIITHMAAWDVPEETGEWKGKPWALFPVKGFPMTRLDCDKSSIIFADIRSALNGMLVSKLAKIHKQMEEL
jgi:hypothetical protein